MLLHCLIDAVRVLKLNVCKIAPDVPLAAAYLGDCTTLLEELNQLCLLRLLVCPSDPNRAAALGFRTALRLSSPRCRRSPVLAITTAPVTTIILPAAARLPSPYRVTGGAAPPAAAPSRRTTPRRAAAAPAAARSQEAA